MAVTAQPQQIVALGMANERRREIADLRAKVKRGEITLSQLMADPPALLRAWPCFDVVRMTWSRPRSGASLERLGRLAVRDGVNLLMPLGRTSQRTRAWIAEHAVWHTVPVNGGTRLEIIVGEDAA